MAEARLYFDWNAGAPMKAAARARLVELLGRPGNGSSVHAEGRAARAVVEGARRSVARLCGAEVKGVTFCSGGTEAANTVLTPDWTLFGKPYRLDRLLVSAVEHPAVARGGRFPSESVEAIPVDGNGVVDLGALERRLAELAAAGERALVSVMMANNETGVVEPIADVARIARAHGALVHSDAVQAAGKLSIDMEALGLDVLTLSAHKIGGGQGVGAIVRGRNGFAFTPLVTGGGQESWARAGTENVAAIGAFGTLLIAVVGRHLTWKGFVQALVETTRVTCMILVIVAGATVFGHFLAVTRIPFDVGAWVLGLQMPPWAVMGMIILIYLTLGCLMDSLAMIMLTIPIFFPVITSLGFDPIWFGVIIVLVTGMGVITPPVGINVYVVAGVARDVPLHVIFRGAVKLLAAQVVTAALLILFPQIALWLPQLMH